MESLKQYYEEKLRRWSRRVKECAFFACRECGERQLIESHHIEPREKFPARIYDIDNGECDCLWLHAFMHKDDIVAQNLVLLRLCKKLTKRLYRPLTKCQKALFQNL